MPKIIENVREQLLCEAKRQVLEQGYAATTVRSVASACGLGVGTVYNYFSSKEMLIATFVYEDWRKYLAVMQKLPADDPHILLEGIYQALLCFEADNKVLFSDADAAKLISVGASGRHKMLCEQIAGFILPVCEDEFCAEFIAEALISHSMGGTEFDRLYSLLEKIIKK